MASIRRNAGRLTGRGLAIAGIILGIIVTALQLFFLFGALQGWTFYTKQMAPPAERFFTASDAGDFSLARDELQPAAGAELTDERIAAFIAAAESANGQYQGVSTSFGTMMESFQRVRATGRAGSYPPNESLCGPSCRFGATNPEKPVACEASLVEKWWPVARGELDAIVSHRPRAFVARRATRRARQPRGVRGLGGVPRSGSAEVLCGCGGAGCAAGAGLCERGDVAEAAGAGADPLSIVAANGAWSDDLAQHRR